MDGSFLSDKGVIAASRKFICIRLATFENAEEAVLLKSMFAGHDDNLENSVYGMFGPDGVTRLTRTGRSPSFAFGRDNETAVPAMASMMERVARRYAKKGATEQESLALPVLPDLRLALNVSSCDNRPLIVAYHPSKSGLKTLESRLAKLAWKPKFIGRSEYVLVRDARELKPVRSLRKDAQPGIYVLQPGAFGEYGRVLRAIPTDGVEQVGLEKDLLAGLARFLPRNKEQQSHVQEGRRLGVEWKSKIENTDSHGKRRRGKGDGRGKGRRRRN